jgi:hypothetical protein
LAFVLRSLTTRADSGIFESPASLVVPDQHAFFSFLASSERHI